MKLKKLIGTVLAATMLVSGLAACGGDTTDPTPVPTQKVEQEDNNSSVDDGTTNTNPVVDETPELLKKEKLDNPNVTIAAYWDITDEAILKAIADFEAKYGGKVTVKVVGWNKGATAIQEAMATGDMFDLVFTEGNARFPQDAIDALYQPIDEWLDYSVFDQASADAFLYKGKHYVFTNYAITSPYLVIYNKTIFEEEGMETPVELFNKGEWTYAKFLEYMEYFTRDTDNDGEIDQWGLGPRFKRQNFAFANDAFVAKEVGDGTLQACIDSEEMRQFYEFLNTFGTINTKCPGDSGWLEQRLCVMFSEAGPSAGLNRDGSSTDEFDFVPLPTYDGRLATTPVWDNGYAMVNGAPNPEGAAVLMTMIGLAKLEAYDAQLAEQYTPEQVERYLTIMEKIVPQRRKYTGVKIEAGESEALKGEPAQTIIETYKSQIEGEVAAYNDALKK